MKELHPEHLIDLRKSGLSDEMIEAAGISTVSPDQINKLLRFDAPISSMLAFPYPGNNGFIRYKLFPPLLRKGETRAQKYHQPPGSGMHLYSPPGFDASNNTVLLTEGEKKALKACQEGLNCCAIAGIWSFAGKDRNGKPQFIYDLEKTAWTGKQVELVPDPDFQIKEPVRHAVYRLGSMLEQNGAQVSIVVLPGEDKLDDFLCKHTIEDFADLPRITLEDPIFQDVKVKEITLQEVIETSLIEVKELKTRKIPERPYILTPWLQPGTLALLIAPRGIGKTWFCLLIALAATRQNVTIGNWKSETPAGVLYIDGEMPAGELQTRMNDLTRNLPESVAPLYILSADLMQKDGMPTPNISNPEWREAIYNLLKGWNTFKVLILDNISSLMPGIDENSKQAWDEINQWLLSIRFLDIAVTLVHHAGKSGDQRGTSGREDNIDITIKLSHPPGYRAEDGAKFNVEFTKARGVYGEGAQPFALQIIEKDGGLTWASEQAGDSSKDLIVAMLGQGISQKDIPVLLGCTRQWVTRVKTQAIKKGHLNKDGSFTAIGKKILGELDTESYTKM